MKFRTAVTKVAFNKKAISTHKLKLNFKRKLVKCYSRGVALCGTVTWSLPEVDQKHLWSFEMWCWRRKEKFIWTDRMRHKEV